MINVLLAAFVVFWIVMIFRLVLTHKLRIRALDVASSHARELIKSGADDWELRFDRWEDPTYDKMIWSLHKWTFKQFYGDLKEVDK